MPRKRHVSRNYNMFIASAVASVMPRKRHVSRNIRYMVFVLVLSCHASQEACE